MSLLAERQKAELSAATPLTVVVEPANEAPAEIVAETSPTQPASTPQARRRTLGITAAVLVALAAMAVVGFVFAPPRKSKVGIVAVGPDVRPGP